MPRDEPPPPTHPDPIPGTEKQAGSPPSKRSSAESLPVDAPPPAPPIVASSPYAESMRKKYFVIGQIFKDADTSYATDEELAKGANMWRSFFAPEGEPPLSDKVTVKDIESYRNGSTARPARQPAVARPAPAPLEEKNKLISDIYYGIHGFGSIAQTVRQVNEYIKEKRINIQKTTAEDVKAWKRGLSSPKSKPGGYNSFIPAAYGVEVQIDLFYMEDLKNVKEQSFSSTNVPLIVANFIFSKRFLNFLYSSYSNGKKGGFDQRIKLINVFKYKNVF
jgi:hypothetical protein